MPSFNRDGVKRRLVEVLRAALPDDVQVTYEWPGDDFPDSYLFLDAPVSGDPTRDSLGITSGAGGLYTDTFSFDGLLASAGHYTARDAEQAAGDLMRTCFELLRSLHRLNDRTGVIPDGTFADYRGVESVAFSSIDGPAAAMPQPDDSGDVTITGMCRFTITCVSHL